MHLNMKYCILKCIDKKVSAYYNKSIKMYYILTSRKRRKYYGNRNGSFKIYRWSNSIRTRAFKSIYV